jgi:integrase
MAARQFSARDVKLAEPGEEFIIPSAKGLRLVVTTVRKTWIYRYRDEAGKLKQVKLGEWPKMGEPAAVAAWATLRADRQSGVDPAAQRRLERLGKTVSAGRFETMSELILDFLDHLDRQRQSASAKAARSRLERLLMEETQFARMKPADVTRSVAFQILDRRRDLPAATKVLRSLLGQATDRALDAGRVGDDVHNWWRLVLHGQLRSKGKLVRGEHVGRSKRVLSEAELLVFLPWAKEHMPQFFYDITYLYLATGLRGVEIVGLRREYIKEEQDGWWATIPAATLKMERDRDIVDHRVPLIGRALEIVQRRMGQERSGWLFWTDRGGVFRPYNQRAFSRYVYDIQPGFKSTTKATRAVLCPVGNWSAHDLRRTARTLLTSLGCSNEFGEAILGHKPAEVLGSYNLHTYDREKRLWLVRLGERLAELDID